MHDCFNVDTDVVTSLLLLVFLVLLDTEHPSLITGVKCLFPEKNIKSHIWYLWYVNFIS